MRRNKVKPDFPCGSTRLQHSGSRRHACSKPLASLVPRVVGLHVGLSCCEHSPCGRRAHMCVCAVIDINRHWQGGRWDERRGAEMSVVVNERSSEGDPCCRSAVLSPCCLRVRPCARRWPAVRMDARTPPQWRGSCLYPLIVAAVHRTCAWYVASRDPSDGAYVRYLLRGYGKKHAFDTL